MEEFGSGQFDTVLVVDVDEEFESVIGQGDEMLPNDVSAEALERVTAIATDLATAGREGQSIGAMFILGDHEEVIKRSKQLVLNPFHGYGPEDRSILNPFMDETIKELALIDGAFIFCRVMEWLNLQDVSFRQKQMKSNFQVVWELDMRLRPPSLMLPTLLP